MKHLILFLVLIILPAVSFAQDRDVLATGAGPDNDQAQSSYQQGSSQPAEESASSGAEEPAYREDWFNWSDASNIADVEKDDNLEF